VATRSETCEETVTERLLRVHIRGSTLLFELRFSSQQDGRAGGVEAPRRPGAVGWGTAVGGGQPLTHFIRRPDSRTDSGAMREHESADPSGRIEIVEPRPGAVVVELLGEQDLAVSARLEVLLESLLSSNRVVVVDLTGSTFIDSSIVRALVRADRLAKAAGTTFRLQFGTAPIVRRALELTGLLDRLETAPTREEALGEDEPSS
jgi:anti-sigma B factor antagonist